MPSLTIRRYEPRDADAVWDLHERALRDAGAFHEAYADRDTDLRAIRAEYLDAGGEFLVGERDGHLVAMGAFQPLDPDGFHAEFLDEASEDTAVIRRMRVHPEWQRRGYGRRLLDELEDRAGDRGFRTAVLDASTDQSAAQSFYPAVGYTELGRETFALDAGPRESVTIVCYRKSL